MKTFLKYLIWSVLVLIILLTLSGEIILHINERQTIDALEKLSVTNTKSIILLEKTLAQQEAFISAKQGVDYAAIAKDLESIHNDLTVMNILHPSPAWEDSHFIHTSKQLAKISSDTERLRQGNKILQDQHGSILKVLTKKEEPTVRKCRPVEMEGSICRP